MRVTATIRNVAFTLLGAAGLVLKRHYTGPLSDLVYRYGGNVCVSFAIYFNARLVPLPGRYNRLVSAALALLVVEAFELTDGFFGLMANTYDPLDLVANAVGVGLAVALDLLVSRSSGSPEVNLAAGHPPTG